MKRKVKWKHPLYGFACCYNRNGKVYTEINYGGKTIRKSTPYNWQSTNKQASLRILEERILSVINPVETNTETENNVNTLFKLITLFFEIHVSHLTITAQRKFKHACYHFLKNDFYLNETENIFQHILSNLKESKLHPNTIRKQVGNLKQMFSFAVDRGYIIRNPISKEMIPK